MLLTGRAFPQLNLVRSLFWANVYTVFVVILSTGLGATVIDLPAVTVQGSYCTDIL